MNSKDYGLCVTARFATEQRWNTTHDIVVVAGKVINVWFEWGTAECKSILFTVLTMVRIE